MSKEKEEKKVENSTENNEPEVDTKEVMENLANKLSDVVIEKVTEKMSKENFQSNKRKYNESMESTGFSVEEGFKKYREQFQAMNEGKSDKVTVAHVYNSQLTDAAGNYTVNKEMGFFIDSLNDAGYVRANATIVPMTTGIQDHPYVSTQLSLSGTTEMDTGQTTNLEFGNVKLTAITDIGICPMSNQLLKNSVYDLAGTVFNEFLIQADVNQDALFVTRVKALGDSYKVSLSSYGSAPQTFEQAITSSTVAFQIFGKLGAKLSTFNARYADGAGIVMHPSTMWHYAGIADTANGRNVVEFVDGKPYMKGVNVFTSNRMTPITTTLSSSNTCYMAFGNMKNVILGDRMTLDIYQAKEGSIGNFSLLTNNAVAWRGIQEYDVQVIPGRFVFASR